jgi:hypothetical protein
MLGSLIEYLGGWMAKTMFLLGIGKLQFGHCGIFVIKYIK